MIEEAAALPEPLAGCGFVYVATRAAFIAEAAESARSLRRFHREPICLVTNAPVAQPPFDQIVVRSELRGDVSAKLAMDACPYDRFVFLDTDTAIVAPLHELFQLLRGPSISAFPPPSAATIIPCPAFRPLFASRPPT